MPELTNLANKKILVTGGSGFLGGHLLPQLIGNGAEVSCLARSPAAAARLPEGCKPIMGDLGNRQDVISALKGQQIVIHMAGLLFGYGWQDYMRANYLAAKNLADGINRLRCLEKAIYISSLAAAGPCAEPIGIAEDCLPAPVSAYGWSKLFCEEVLSGALGDRLVILRPPIIYGSGDKGLLPLFKSVSRGLGLSPGLRRFPVSAIHVSDAVQAILLSAQKRASGIYHLTSGEIYDMDSFCRAMATALGKKSIHVLRPPLPLMGVAAAVSSGWGLVWRNICGLFGRQALPPRWNLDKYREAKTAGWVANGQRIMGELGYRPQMKIEQGMAETVAGYRASGWL